MSSEPADDPGSETAESVTLPAPVYDRVTARLPYTEFDTEREYVVHVLEEVLVRVESEGGDESDATGAVDEAEVRSRLESLGYLDG